MKDLFNRLKKSLFAAVTLFGVDTTDYLPESMVGYDTLGEFVYQMIQFATGIAALLAVIILIWNGIQYILSGGDEGKVDKATKGITYAIIGLILCFISILVISFILENILMVDINT